MADTRETYGTGASSSGGRHVPLFAPEASILYYTLPNATTSNAVTSSFKRSLNKDDYDSRIQLGTAADGRTNMAAFSQHFDRIVRANMKNWRRSVLLPSHRSRKGSSNDEDNAGGSADPSEQGSRSGAFDFEYGIETDARELEKRFSNCYAVSTNADVLHDIDKLAKRQHDAPECRGRLVMGTPDVGFTDTTRQYTKDVPSHARSVTRVGMWIDPDIKDETEREEVERSLWRAGQKFISDSSLSANGRLVLPKTDAGTDHAHCFEGCRSISMRPRAVTDLRSVQRIPGFSWGGVSSAEPEAQEGELRANSGPSGGTRDMARRQR